MNRKQETVAMLQILFNSIRHCDNPKNALLEDVRPSSVRFVLSEAIALLKGEKMIIDVKIALVAIACISNSISLIMTVVKLRRVERELQQYKQQNRVLQNMVFGVCAEKEIKLND